VDGVEMAIDKVINKRVVILDNTEEEFTKSKKPDSLKH
jgi:hypothetical protein